VCKHRRALIVGHLKQKREFPAVLGAQFGDIWAALGDAQDDSKLWARESHDYVAQRDKRVMTYPGSKVPRRFGGSLLDADREKLEYLARVDGAAEALLGRLVAAEDWYGWCCDAVERWTKGWRPGRVEKDMLYVDEETLVDLRRYKWEINQKRVAIDLRPIQRPLDNVYKRQQGHIKLLNRLWSLTTSAGAGQ
jgi:hypothetical protein